MQRWHFFRTRPRERVRARCAGSSVPGAQPLGGLRLLAGYTLVELMIALSVVAILTAAAAPSMADLIRRNRIASLNNELVASLQYARAEALQRGRQVSVCSSSDLATCNGGADWSAGWLVVVDSANSGAPAIVELLRVAEGVSPGATATASTGDGYFRFGPTGAVGWAGTGGAAERSVRIAAPNCREAEGRLVSISRIGRLRSEAVPCA